MIEFVEGPRNLEGHRTQQVPKTFGEPTALVSRKTQDPSKTQNTRRVQNPRTQKDPGTKKDTGP